MRYTLQWTDANGKTWHLKTAAYTERVIRNLRKLMPSLERKNGTHAAFITLTAVPTVKRK